MVIDYQRKQLLIGLLIATCVGAFYYYLWSSEQTEIPEQKVLNLMYQSRGQEPLSAEIAVVTIDDTSLGRLGWPIDLRHYVTLIDLAFEHGATSIGFSFALNGQAKDIGIDLLKQKLQKHQHVILPGEFKVSNGNNRHGPSGLIQAYDMVSSIVSNPSKEPNHLHLGQSADGGYYHLPVQLFYGGSVSAFALQLFLEHHHKSDSSFGLIRANDALSLMLGNKLKANIPLDYRRDARIHYKSIGAGVAIHDILLATGPTHAAQPTTVDLKALFENKAVIVGTTALSLGQHVKLPLAEKAPLFYAHVNALDNLFTQSFLIDVPRWFVSLCIIFGALFFSLMVLVLRSRWAALLLIAAATLIFWLSYHLFESQHIFLPAATMVLCWLSTWFIVSVYRYFIVEARERTTLEAVGIKVAQPILDHLLRNPEQLILSGHKLDTSVICIHVVGYDELSSEESSGESDAEVVDLLRLYLTLVSSVIHDFHGTIQPYSGDSLLAYFGAPLPMRGHECAALLCAQAMQESVANLNQERTGNKLKTLSISISISTGSVHCGNFGTKKRIDYTVVGKPVTLATTLTGLAQPGQTLIGSRTYQAAQSLFQFKVHTQLKLSGYATPQKAYEVLFDAKELVDQKNLRSSPRLSLNRPFTVRLASGTAHGAALNISSNGMYVRSEHQVTAGQKITIDIIVPINGKEIPLEIDGIVRHTRDDETGSSGFGMVFTSVVSQSREAIEYMMGVLVGELVQSRYKIEHKDSGDGTGVYELHS